MSQACAIDAGLTATAYAGSHSLGSYRSVSVAGTYEVAHCDNHTLETRLRAALANTIQRYPALQLGVDFELFSGRQARYVPLTVISLDNVFEFTHVRVVDPVPSYQHELDEERNESLSRELELATHYQFTEPYKRPAWKVTIVRHGDPPANLYTGTVTIDVIFSMNHALCDGLSCVIFHQSLAENLSDLFRANSSPEISEVHCSTSARPPASMEDALNFPFDIDADGLTVRAARPPEQLQAAHAKVAQYKYHMPCVRIVEIPESQLRSTLKRCKALGGTLTGYLHALVLGYLARNTHQYDGVSAVTPINIRRFTGASPIEMVNHASGAATNWPHNLVEAFANCPPHSPEEEKLIKEAISMFTHDLQTEMANIKSSYVLRKCVQGFEKLLTTPEDNLVRGDPEKLSYEICNVGMTDPSPSYENTSDPPVVKIKKLMLCQCSQGRNVHFKLNFVSVKGEGISVLLCWEDTTWKLSLMDGLMGELKSRFAANIDEDSEK